MIIRDSLHKRYNRNHNPKSFSWDGSDTTSKIVCTDASRSIRMANDWTLACLVKPIPVTANGICLYSDYFGTDGIFISYTVSTNRISVLSRTDSTNVTVDLPTSFNNYQEYTTIILSYEATTKIISVNVNSVDYGTIENFATNEWAIGNDFGLFSIPSTFFNYLFEGVCSSYCILDKQADNAFIESFNTFGEPDSASYGNVTFFTDFSKINDKGTYNGLECSTTFYNSSSTTKEIKFEGFTDEELGLTTDTQGITTNCYLKDFYSTETEDAYGLNMGDLWYTETGLDNASVINIDLESGTTNHTAGWTNGYSVTFKGNLAYRPNIPSASTETIGWFCSGNASLRTDGVDDVYLLVTGITGTFLHTQVKIDRNNVYTLTVTAAGVYTMYVNGVKRTQETKTFVPLNNDVNPMVIGVLSPKRFYKHFQSIRVYDGVLTDAQASSVLGSELDTYSPLCSFSTNISGTDALIDNTGNLADTSAFASHTAVDTVVETESSMQPRRKGLQFERTKEEYLEVASLPQIDVNTGCTVIAVVNDVEALTRTLAWFSDEVAVNNLMRILFRTGTPNVIGFNSNTATEIQLEVSENESNRLVWKLSNQTQTEPKNTFNKIGGVNKDTLTRTEAFVRNGATYNLYIGGVPPGVTFGSEQYMNIIFESFILVNGVMDDADIDKIVHNNKVGNIPLELQEKYDFELVIDFNNVYDDAGTLKIKDLSGNNHDILAKSDSATGWQTLADLQASQVDL